VFSVRQELKLRKFRVSLETWSMVDKVALGQGFSDHFGFPISYHSTSALY